MVKSENIIADFIILGGGASGLSAAVAAAEKGASTIIIEKRGALGGNAIMAGGIFAAESPTQKRLKIDLRKDECFRTAMNHSHWKINPYIIRTFIDKSGDTIKWLENKGLNFVPFIEPIAGQGGFHLPTGAGIGLVKHLTDECKKLGVNILLHTDVKKINSRTKGELFLIEAKSNEIDITLKSRSILIATGGYGGNKEMLKKYCLDYRDNMTCYGVPNNGDGISLAMALGADTAGLGILHMAGPTLPKSIVLNINNEPNVVRVQLSAIILEPNTVWVNKRGKRFTDESIGYNHFGSANTVVIQPDNESFTVFDNNIVNGWIENGFILGMGGPMGLQGKTLHGLATALQEHVKRGWVNIANKWDEIAEWMGADPQILESTISKYNSDCENRYDTLFNKNPKYLLPLLTPPFYAVKARADFLSTIGGIKINEYMEVLDKKDIPIPGLYAAGVDTGGWNSDTYNGLLPGNAFGFSVNSGRIAGENAAKYALELKSI
ncbi:MAG: FAD-dependent oxidoreductase [Dehalococcoidales bacterium]|nr:FAD-dependent oxidoreductase [Dehalococcoidales bacterium]